MKVYIEKPFDSIKWTTILASLRKMKFLPIQISWVQECLSSSSFSLIINGSHFPWFSSSRCVCQGDPFSPLLFILVTQNLSTIMSHALLLYMILGLDFDLRFNFDQVMFTDDLILITKASKLKAGNYIFIVLISSKTLLTRIQTTISQLSLFLTRVTRDLHLRFLKF